MRLSLSLLSTLVLVRLLGIERFGVWMVMNSILGLYPIFDLGLGATVTYRLAWHAGRRDWVAAGRDLGTSFVLVTAAGAIAGSAMWIGSPGLSRFLFAGSGDAEVVIVFKVLAVLVIARSWQAWAVATESARLEYRRQTALETAAVLLCHSGALALAAFGYGVLALAVWTLLITIVADLGHFFVMSRLWERARIRVDLSREVVGQLARLGVSNWLSNIGSVLFGHVDRIIVNVTLGPAAAGLYAAATSVAAKINELAAFPLRVVAPGISAALAAGSLERVRWIFLKASRINGLISFVLVSAVLAGSGPLATQLVGHEAPRLVALLEILAVIYGLFVLNVVPYWAATGVGKPLINARWGVAGGLATCVLLLLLCGRFQLSGAAWANAGYLLTLAIGVEVAKRIGLRPGHYLKAVAPAAAGILVLPALTAGGISSAWPVRLALLGSLHCAVGFLALGPVLRQQLADCLRGVLWTASRRTAELAQPRQ